MKQRKRIMATAVSITPNPGERVAEEPTIAKRYKLPRYVVEVFKEESPQYGSQGRAIQMAAEILERLHSPLKPLKNLKRGRTNPDEQVGMSYKLVPRTIQIIDRLSTLPEYGSRGRVLECLAQTLFVKRLCVCAGKKKKHRKAK